MVVNGLVSRVVARSAEVSVGWLVAAVARSGVLLSGKLLVIDLSAVVAIWSGVGGALAVVRRSIVESWLVSRLVAVVVPASGVQVSLIAAY